LLSPNPLLSPSWYPPQLSWSRSCDSFYCRPPSKWVCSSSPHSPENTCQAWFPLSVHFLPRSSSPPPLNRSRHRLGKVSQRYSPLFFFQPLFILARTHVSQGRPYFSLPDISPPAPRFLPLLSFSANRCRGLFPQW